VPGASRKSQVAACLRESPPGKIGEAEFEALRARFPGLSERSLREVLRSSGIPLSPLVEGIRQTSLEELERTLLAMLDEYRRASEGGNRERLRQCRRAVIAAKDHARFARLKADAQRRLLKEEMILWMLTWLENPALFPDWLRLRRSVLASR